MFKDLHPDRGSRQIYIKEVVTTGRNFDKGDYGEEGFIKCSKCGYTLNKERHPKGWGEGNVQASTQLNGAVTLAASTITVDSTSSFATPKTGSITAFTKNGVNRTTVTCSGHGLKGGQVTITSTTSYNGTFYIDNIRTDYFDIPKAFVADDATGTWTVAEYIYIHDVGTYATTGDVSSVYTAATGGPRVNKVSYTGKTSTTFTGCSGALAHDDDMYVKGERKATGGCPFCGSYNYD